MIEPSPWELPPPRGPRRRETSTAVRWWRLWRTRRPRTFSEKVRYKMIRDHRALMVTLADKVAVRDHVAALVGEDVLPRALHVLDDPAALARVDLPEAFVLKPAHGSGAAVIVSPTAPAEARLPEPRYAWVYRHVRPEHAPVDHLAAIGRAWATQLYGQGPNREWAYSRVPRRVLVEEFLAGRDDDVPDDYKFFVFHGVCHYVQLDRGRFRDRTQDFYTRAWEHLPLNGGHPWAVPPIGPPARLAEMLDLAERLGAGTDFVRVDLYALADRVVFGELTSLPAGGDSPFDPAGYDLEFGSHWQVPARYRS
ncbi:ATP-grasp fold amidoligase family protein [Nocardioides sp. 1609]|uniref:ATP-grasp fold amidoligase family protein n=1 Tax=Nocardioides sp. 1609 TaxID=2508327 RepID=UPI001AD962CC|nr:ATP-grasp fold amidoligase family protein [Nocardioides sp. 1609]